MLVAGQVRRSMRKVPARARRAAGRAAAGGHLDGVCRRAEHMSQCNASAFGQGGVASAEDDPCVSRVSVAVLAVALAVVPNMNIRQGQPVFSLLIAYCILLTSTGFN